MKNQTFKTSFGLRNRNVQTLYSSFFRKFKTPKIEIEKFELEDGDFLECYWLCKPKKEDTKPIVVLFHGLAGSFYSPYIQGAMNSLDSEGFSTVVMHFRSCSGKENNLARSYHSGETLDAKAWLEHLHVKFPHAKLFAVGYSLGANMLLKLLGEEGENSLLSAAVSVSAPMQLDLCANKMDRGFSRFYQYILMKNLKLLLLEKYKKHNMKALIGIDEKEVKKLRSFWEFDGAYTAPIHGFSSAEDYYKKSSAKQFLKYIEIPTLIINALDDPFMTKEVLPKEQLPLNISLEISEHGGHVGFIGGSFFQPEYWLDTRITEYFKSFMKRGQN